MVDLVFKDSEKKHKFHLVNPSPWPLVGAFSALFLVSGAILYMHYEMLWPMLAGLVLILFTMFMWWRDIIKESTFLKVHNSITEIGLRWGMALFITSEVMFFVAFFWAFFDASLLPKTFLAEYKEVFTGTLGIGVWPPKGIETFDPLDIPYLNTLILLLSGTTCTWAHHELREGNNKEALKGSPNNGGDTVETYSKYFQSDAPERYSAFLRSPLTPYRVRLTTVEAYSSPSQLIFH